MASSPVFYQRLCHWAAIQPEAPFIVEAGSGDTLTYAGALAAVEATQRALGDAPLTIMLALSSGIANATLWLAALAFGHTLVPVSPDCTPHEVRRLVQLFPPDLAMVEHADDAPAAATSGRVLTRAEIERVLWQAAAPSGGTGDTRDRPRPSGGSVCLMTSGSSGAPKGVVLGEAQLVWTAEQIRRSHGLTPADRGLAVLPFFHINAPVVSLCASLLAGASVVIAPRFSRGQFWAWIERHRVTWASVVPAIVAMLLQTDRPDYLPGTLRFVRTASAPLPPLQLRRFEQRFGIPIIETYGLTEAASQVCANPLPPERHLPGSVGRPEGVALRICQPLRDDSPVTVTLALADVPAGETGEVCIAGPSVIAGYASGAGGATFQDGWFRTGDLGFLDTDGYLHLTGRLREMILHGGETIAPREVEETLIAHPAVAEAAVVGRPDAVYGERVVAYVVPRERPGPDAATLAATLRQHCVSQLSLAKVPEFIVFIAALPRTPNGKLDRQRLRAEQADEQTAALRVPVALNARTPSARLASVRSTVAPSAKTDASA
ncbi:MAG: AMP-binding protein [Ktedonobacterales bacterium]